MDKLQVLNKYFGYDSFRDGQDEIIDSILSKKETLAIMPTGGGKSICYQIPALMFDGITVVVSPLISLMKDQVDALTANGIPAVCINSSSSFREQSEKLSYVLSGNVKLVYVAPERLFSDIFIDTMIQTNVSLVAVDEAHCISQWGHDFRKSYTEISNFVKQLPSNPMISAFTATATPQVRTDITTRLNLKNPATFVTGFDRKNLKFSVVTGENSRDFIDKYLQNNKGQNGIIYASTRKEVDSIYDDLLDDGYKVGKYHAGLKEDEKRNFQDQFIYDEINIMVATNAFGMGIDKSNVRFVIHNNLTKDIESYYQEAGRAGRDGLDSECILIFNPKDIITQNYFIDLSRQTSSQEQVQIKKDKLNSIVNYCHTSNCIRGYILKYFGEENVEENCGNCSNCLGDQETVDITIEAQKIISCVHKLPYSFGGTMIANILKGSKRKEILDKNFDNLSTYGIMENYSTKEIREIINSMIGDGYLSVSTGEYSTIKLSDKAISVIKDREKVFRKVLKVEKVETQPDNELYTKLKILRKELADEEGMPPYIIFNDKTLMELAQTAPQDENQLLKVKGFGEMKVEKYGVPILELITSLDVKPMKPRKEKKKRKKRAGSSAKESLSMYKKGFSIEEISHQRGFALTTIEGHIFDTIENIDEIIIEDFVDEKQESIIREVINKVGKEALNPIKSKIPEDYTYSMIKAVLCKMRLE